MTAARQVLRWLLVVLLAPAALLFLLLGFPSGGLSLPLGVLFAGVTVGLLQDGYMERPSGLARWLIYAGLTLLAVEVVFFAFLAAKNN